ncbi:MAG: hypothetical protein FJ087_07960 [Deltaproteobacteria bacterium]|nr:hypothetical protein [Deltaproteobacteria bacterium]
MSKTKQPKAHGHLVPSGRILLTLVDYQCMRCGTTREFGRPPRDSDPTDRVDADDPFDLTDFFARRSGWIAVTLHGSAPSTRLVLCDACALHVAQQIKTLRGE